MSDFRDILGLGKHEPGAAPARRPKPSVQKPEGMSREVFALLHNDGDSMHAPAVPLVPTTAPPDGFKEKEHRLIGWEWRPFENAARTDALRLRHWKKNNDKNTTYTFARFNKTVRILSYSDSEYATVLQHATWTKEETDALFEKCRQFDLRWPVIHDRLPGSRSMEELKERYYEACRSLLQARLSAAAEGSGAATVLAEHPLATFQFDSAHEVARKREFERLYERSAEEAAEEARRLEQAKALEARLRGQRKALKPGGKAATLQALKASLSASGLGAGDDLALGGLPSLAGLMEAPKRPRSVGAWLRSADLSTKKPAADKQLTHFDGRMRDVAMPAKVLPSEANVRLYNSCRAHLVLLVELESKIKRLEYEKGVLLARRQGTALPPLPAQASGAGKRVRSDAAERSGKRSHHGPRS
uniref:Myb-like domain-containing protein n=1 Tax=Emiliania huxleyi TaxID=2903 RepID=A0A7S3SCL8_EMIHU